MLEARSQTNLAQITANAPNVSLRPADSSSGSALVAYIRGIGQTDFNPSVEPGIGIYVDDVYYSTITGNLLDLLDLDRVEVLRGPQGTLAGTQRDRRRAEAVHAQAGRQGRHQRLVDEGRVQPHRRQGCGWIHAISDKLHVRVAGMARSMDGYVNALRLRVREPPAASGNPAACRPMCRPVSCKLGTEGGQSYASGRFSLRWDADRQILARCHGEHHERQFGVAAERARVAADHACSSFPWVTPNGPCSRRRSLRTCPNNPSFTATSHRAVRVHPGADLLRQQPQRHLRGGNRRSIRQPLRRPAASTSTIRRTSTTARARRVRCSKEAWRTRIRASSSRTCSLPSTRCTRGMHAINLNWKLTDSVSLLSVSSYRTY